jgi:hypothetical protein
LIVPALQGESVELREIRALGKQGVKSDVSEKLFLQ